MELKMSTLFIKNGYCCGRGDIVNRLENWCLANKIEYIKTHVTEASTAQYEDKIVELSPNITLLQVLTQLGLESSRS